MSGLNNIQEDFKGKTAYIFGLGLLGGGIGVAKFFHSIGVSLIISDRKSKEELASSLEKLKGIPATYCLGGHKQSDIDKADFIIRNPGVPSNHSLIEYARKIDKPIYMETALFSKYFQKNVIGITGTRGKTTTATLMHKVLEKTLGQKVILAGNIPGQSTIEHLRDEEDVWGAVLELSSWQLQGYADLQISPPMSIFTNIYPDHLNRYESMDEYIQDKKSIYKFQKDEDILFYNQDNQIVSQISEEVSNAQGFSAVDAPVTLKTRIIGQHNRENIAAVLKISQHLGLDQDIVYQTISEFDPVPFRLQSIKVVNGVEYINDTTSTTPVALQKAVESIEKPTILIMGGSNKNLPLEGMVDTLNKSTQVKKILLIPGDGSESISHLINPQKLEKKDTLDMAVQYAYKIAGSGDTVLLSPGFASFSQFTNEFHRGEVFNKLVRAL